MDHQERATFFAWVFDSATYTIRRALEDAGFARATANTAAAPSQASLDKFRKNFDGRSFLDDAVAFATRWTPDHCKVVFADLVAPLQSLGGSMPAAATAATDLQRRLGAIPASAASDGCAVFDDLLTSFVQPTLVQISVAHWARYRATIAAASRAAVDQATADARLSDEIRSFYEAARVIAKTNDVVLGSLVEEFVRSKIAATVHPLQTSSGGIYGLGHISQIDCLIWDRQGYPAAIEVGHVAVVAPQAVRGVVEIKASYDSKLAEFAERIIRFEAEGSVLQDVCGMARYPRALGILVWTEFEFERVAALAGQFVLPLFRRIDGKLEPNPVGVAGLLQFLKSSVLFKP